MFIEPLIISFHYNRYLFILIVTQNRVGNINK